MPEKFWIVHRKQKSLPFSIVGRADGHAFLKRMDWGTQATYEPYVDTDQNLLALHVPVSMGCAYSELSFLDAPRAPGEFHPRIARNLGLAGPIGFNRTNYFLELYKHEIGSYLRGTAFLWEQANRTLRVIEPTRKHLDVYGHELRHLLILACTEVEEAFVSTLAANGFEASKAPEDRRWNTSHFYNLKDPMRLNEWSIRWPYFPDLDSFQPFADWNMPGSTTSLPWYDAYNKTKHGRSEHLPKASLKHVLNALAAVAILGAAQFGAAPDQIYEGPTFMRFEVVKQPDWTLEEHYFGPFGGEPEPGLLKPKLLF